MKNFKRINNELVIKGISEDISLELVGQEWLAKGIKLDRIEWMKLKRKHERILQYIVIDEVTEPVNIQKITLLLEDFGVLTHTPSQRPAPSDRNFKKQVKFLLQLMLVNCD